MSEFNLTSADIDVVIEAFGALKDSGMTSENKKLLSREITCLKKLKQHIEDNNIFIVNKWLLDSLLNNEQE